MPHPYWSEDFANVNMARVASLFGIIEERIMPTLGDIEKEADAKEAEVLLRLRAEDSGSVRTRSIEDDAREQAFEHWQALRDTRQALLNGFAIAFYHLWEQQVIAYYRQRLLVGSERTNHAVLNLNGAVSRLSSLGVDVTQFTSWSRLKVFRYLANTLKHADGESAEKLRKSWPKVFVYPNFRDDEFMLEVESGIAVHEPLGGDGVFVDLEDLRQFKVDTEAFWREFVAATSELA